MPRKGFKFNDLRLSGNDRGQARSLGSGLFSNGRSTLVWRKRICNDAIELCGIHSSRGWLEFHPLLPVWRAGDGHPTGAATCRTSP